MDTSNDTNEPTPDAVEPTASDTPSIARLVRTADRLLRVAAGDALRAEDVHPRQLRALRAVASGHVSPRGGRAVRALLLRGWVQVGADGTALTADGQDALDRLSGVARDARDAVAASLSDGQTTALADGLTALIEAAGGEAALERARSERHARIARLRDVPGFPWGPGLPFAPRFGGRDHAAHAGHGERRGHGDTCHGNRAHHEPRGFGHGARAGGDRHPGFDEHRCEEHRFDEHRGGRGYRAHRSDRTFGHGRSEYGHDHGAHEGRHGGQRRSEHAFERGFAAGLEAAHRSHLDRD